MSGYILCQTKKAERPYYIENISMNIYSIEELCYYLYHNLYLADHTIFNEELCSWIRDELELPHLAAKLKQNLERNVSIEDMVYPIFKEINYLTYEEMKSFNICLADFGKERQAVRQKRKGDALVENGMYVNAIQVYQKILEREELFNDPPVTYMTEYNDMVRYHTEKREGQQAAPVVFQWKGYGEDAACNFSFDVHKGECLAVQIMDARGMEELRKILTGDILPESGELLLNGKQTEIPGNCRIAVIQERTTKTMIFPELDYMNNLCICLTEKVPSIWHNKRLQKSIRNEYSPILGSDVFEMPVEELSEKQKYQLVYTRVLLQKPEILFCIQPFCGADLAHRMFIWSMLEKFLDKGISVVILSLNLSDSLAMADRLLILGENGEKREIARENFHKITSPVPWLHMYLSERK